MIGLGDTRRDAQVVLVLLLVLVLDCPISDYENEDDDEDEKFERPARIWTHTGRMGKKAGVPVVVSRRASLGLARHFCAVQPQILQLAFSTINQPECEERYDLPTNFNSSRAVLRDQQFALFSLRRGITHFAHR